jgi:lysophospholipase
MFMCACVHSMGGVADQASDRGLVIVNVTQCSSGTVEPHYATGQSLAAAGVVAGGDMTPEAALTKLVRLLSQGSSSLLRIA